MRKFRTRLVAAVCATSLILGAGAAMADTLQVDGDTGVPSDIVHKVCGAVTVPGDITLSYNGNKHFAAEEPLTISATVDPDNPGVSSQVDMVDPPQMPDTWTDRQSTSFPITTTVAAGTSDGNYKVSYTVTGDLSGNSLSNEVSFIVQVDCSGDGSGGGDPGDPCDAVSAPAAPVFAFNPNGLNGWYTSIPTVSATSATTGAVVSYSTASGGPYDAAPTLSDGTTTVYAVATEPVCNKQSSEASREYKVDTTAPLVSVTSPLSQDYDFGGVPAAACTASDPTPGSGLADADAVAEGVQDCVISGYSTTLGEHTVTASAVDQAGNIGNSAPVTYWVNYAIDYSGACPNGIRQPINCEKDAMSVFSRGKSVPVKWGLFGDSGPNGFIAPGWATITRSQQVCPSSTTPITPESGELISSSSAGLRYDVNADQYVFNGDFSDKAAGTCWKVIVALNDHRHTTLSSAMFKLQK